MTLQELKNQFPAAPEYLTQIFLIQRDQGKVPNARLADRLGVSRPAVSQAVGRLKKLSLVKQDRYGAIELTSEGQVHAENVVRRHFLIEHLLVRVLEYPWDLSDVEAETLQASVSSELADFLDKRFNYPQTCPHGNPMPGSKIEKSYLESPALTEAKAGSTVKVIRITEEGEMTDGMLTFCQSKGIEPGRVLKIVSQQPEECVCQDKNGKDVSIPLLFAAQIRWEA